MSDTDGPAFQIDTEAFGLPTGINEGETPGAGFMYSDDDLEVDENDPIYQATKAAWERQHGSTPPKPGEEERPPEMPTGVEDADEVAGEADPDPDADEEKPDLAPAASGDESVRPELGATDGDGDGDPSGEDGLDDGGSDAPQPGHLKFSVDGTDIELNTDQAEYLLRVNTWLESVPQDVKGAWAAIEAGTHVAISNEELQRLQAAAKNPTAKRAAQAPDLDDLDDDTAEYIRSLEQQIPQDGGAPTADAPPQPDQMELQAAFQRQAEQRAAMQAGLDQTNAQYREKYSLDEDQMSRLEEVAANLQVIPSIKRSMTQYSPTGQVIREPAFSDVVAQAYEMAMAQDPTLRQIRDDITYNQRVAAEASRNNATNAKKAKASTLASAPSAAVPAGVNAPSISPDNKMDLNATSEAIAKAIAEMRE